MPVKILFIVNVDWFFISHRLPIAIAAIKSGYEVHLACAITDQLDYLESLGIKVHPISLSRSGTGLLKEIKVVRDFWKIVKYVKPDVCHTITVKCVIYGGLVTRLLNVRTRVASISGLGYIFIENSLRVKVLKFIIKKFYRIALGDDTQVIFQNDNDLKLFTSNKIINSSKAILIRGSGVDLNVFKYKPEPTTQKTVMFLARLLKDKGLIEFFNAAEIVKNKINARFILVGDVDLDNPNSIREDELTRVINTGIVEHWGHSKNVEKIIPQSHIMVLPSYREGLPKSLLEAAACGRAVITTDVPGCRDAIVKDQTGLLVEVKNVDDLASAIIKLLEDDDLRFMFGKFGRKLAEQYFNINNVISLHLKIYRGFQ